MPVPTLITDLSTTAASNYPSGSDSPSTLDDVQRAHASFIAGLRDNPTANATTLTPVAKGGTGASTLTGLVKGNGTSAMTAAVSGTDYQAPIGTIVGIAKGNGANALAAASSADILSAIGASSVNLNFTAGTGYASNTTLTTSEYGKFIYVSGTSTMTLPVAAAGDIGKTITLYNYNAGTGPVTVATQSSQNLYYQGIGPTTTSIVLLGVGDFMTFVNYSGTAWMAYGSNSIGVGQTYQSVARTSGSPYTNSTGKPITVMAQATWAGGASTAHISIAVVVGGVSLPTQVFYTDTSHLETGVYTFIVPNNTSYTITVSNGGSGGAASLNVVELR